MAWYTIDFDANGGTLNSPTTLYNNTSGYWATTKSTNASYRIDSITPPTRANFIFNRFALDNWSVTSSSGYLYPYQTQSGTAVAEWLAYSKISLSKGQYGAGGTDEFYYKLDGGGYYADKQLTQPITSITPPTGGGDFAGYKLGDVIYIDSQGQFTQALLDADPRQNYTLTAGWNGGCLDYFSLGNSALVPKASNLNEEIPRDSVAHLGKAASGVVASSRGIWRNPTVTYAVKADTTLAVTLGKAYAAIKSGDVMTVSGYMITSVEVQTEVGRFPTVTITGTANEGADAINKWAVSIPIVARSRAQNLLDAVSGGGSLKRLTLVASADAVVLSESPAPSSNTNVPPYNRMPCASDIVNGRFEISGETTAASGQDAPEAANGFAVISTSSQDNDVGFRSYDFEMRKEMT